MVCYMSQFYKQFCTETFDEDGLLSDFSVNCPPDFNYGYDVVDALADLEPDKQALVWCDTDGNERRFSFGEISRLSSQCANALKADGIRKGDMVMVMLKRHYEYWYVTVALHKLGAIAIPATNMLTSKDIIYRVQSASIKAIICTPSGDVPDNVLQALPDCPSLTHRYIVRTERDGFVNLTTRIEQADNALERISNSSLDPMMLYFTSGTTGHPKPVLHDYSYPLAHIVTAKHWQNVSDGGLHLTVAETGWAKASWGKIFGQWLVGSAVMVYDFDKFSPGDLLAVMEKYKVTTFCAPPTIYRFFVKHGLGKYDLSSLAYCTNAGEALNPEIYREFFDATGIKLMESFGQTETTPIVLNVVGSEARVGSMGKANPLYDVALVDEFDNPVPPNEEGEIVVRKPESGRQIGMLVSYGSTDSTETTRVWRDGIYHTGDLARMDEDGYIWFVGRCDDIIKSSGYRIGPFEIESVLMEHEAVLECAITGVPDPDRGQIIKATIVLSSGYEPSRELSIELQEFVKKNTAPYKYPRMIAFVQQLPKTISGKVRRVALREHS